jgi:hypothetical protein
MGMSVFTKSWTFNKGKNKNRVNLDLGDPNSAYLSTCKNIHDLQCLLQRW